MSASTTRLLVLGVVRIFEPANGYQLRRELLSWQVDRWANIQPGSIYSMLNSLARAGLIARHELTDETGHKDVAVYVTTEAGQTELTAAIGQAVSSPNAMDPAGFRAALSLLPFIGREEFLRLLGERAGSLATLRREIADKLQVLRQARYSPPHVVCSVELEDRLLAAEVAWLAEFIPRVAAGEFTFLGEPDLEWAPAADDPGWAMIRQRERYRQLLDHRLQPQKNP